MTTVLCRCEVGEMGDYPKGYNKKLTHEKRQRSPIESVISHVSLSLKSHPEGFLPFCASRENLAFDRHHHINSFGLKMRSAKA
jgi:hypothetical protein